MKEARVLIRIAHQGIFKPPQNATLLDKARKLAAGLKGKAINLRVSPMAIEFDLFCSPEIEGEQMRSAFLPLGTVITIKRLDVPPVPVDPEKVVQESRHLFNEHRFWEVHEVLEALWKETQGSEKQLVQGFILVAAALVHAQKDEEAVMWKMLADALPRLEGQPEIYYGWKVRQFREHFARVLIAKKLDFPTV